MSKKVNMYVLKFLRRDRKQACADSKRESKMTKINFPVAHVKFSILPIPEARPQVLLKNRTGC
jgi:Na+-transporting methylmalonyl-CoA/oxaloacetate decarboxylase beta subunit